MLPWEGALLGLWPTKKHCKTRDFGGWLKVLSCAKTGGTSLNNLYFVWRVFGQEVASWRS